MNHGYPFIYLNSKEKSKESRNKGEAPLKKVKPKSFQKKIMITVFWDYKGVISIDFHSQGNYRGAKKF